MTKGLINDPAHWCERAAEGRRTADQMTDPMSQGMMLAIVDDYSRLAERAQRLVVPKPGTLLWAACSNLREGDDRCRRPHQLGRAWAGHSGPVVSRPPAPRRGGRGAAGVLDRGPPTGGRIEGWKSGCS